MTKLIVDPSLETGRCLLCGNDFILQAEKENKCKFCHSGPRVFKNKKIGWLYDSEWKSFERSYNLRQKFSLGIIPLMMSLRANVLEVIPLEKWSKKISQQLETAEKLSDNRFNVMTWGPPFAGKTWLFYAFQKQVGELSRVKYQDIIFDFDVTDKMTGESIDISSGPPIIGTGGTGADFMQSLYKFQKKCKKGKEDSGLISEVNSHIHEILAIDAKGSQEIFVDAQDEITWRARIESASNADLLMLLVDMNMQKDYCEKFIKSIDAILDTLYDKGNHKFSRHLAVCVPKADEHNIRHVEKDNREMIFWQMLEDKFGRTIKNNFEKKIEQFSDDFKYKIEYFFVSSCGYLKNNSVNIKNGQIAQLDQWCPEGVHEPFFWAFNDIEKRRIETLGYHLLYHLLVWPEENICDSRTKEYIPYENIVKLAKGHIR